MTIVAINPGSGDVDGATRELAEQNLQQFVSELGIAVELEHVKYLHGHHHPDNDPSRTGRWCWILRANGRQVEIDMPGAPPNKVQLRDGDNAWHFYRLYVNGSSWLWPYALTMARVCLTDEES